MLRDSASASSDTRRASDAGADPGPAVLAMRLQAASRTAAALARRLANGPRDPAQALALRCDDRCDLGQLLYRDLPLHQRGGADYRATLEAHRRFHDLAASLALRDAGGDAVGAKALRAGAFAAAAQTLAEALARWHWALTRDARLH